MFRTVSQNSEKQRKSLFQISQVRQSVLYQTNFCLVKLFKIILISRGLMTVLKSFPHFLILRTFFPQKSPANAEYIL